MIPDFSGDFINSKSVNDGDIGTFVSEGAIEYSEALKKEMFNIKLDINGKVKIWTPNNTQGLQLQKAFGKDTKDWIGKKIQFFIIQDKLMIKTL